MAPASGAISLSLCQLSWDIGSIDDDAELGKAIVLSMSAMSSCSAYSMSGTPCALRLSEVIRQDLPWWAQSAGEKEPSVGPAVWWSRCGRSNSESGGTVAALAVCGPRGGGAPDPNAAASDGVACGPGSEASC